MLTAYQYEYTGLWLGGKMIVVASNEADARRVARERLTTTAFDARTLKLVRHTPLTENSVIYDDNGNY